MVRGLLVANSLLLMLFVSMYLGTGWSLLLFSFPVARDLTVDNYALVFVTPVERATRFFTKMTTVMIASALVMVVGEWGSGFVVFPIVVLLLVVAATWVTVRWIFPPNKVLKDGVTDPAVLERTLRQWMRLNRWRTGLWTLQWLTMALYFGLKI